MTRVPVVDLSGAFSLEDLVLLAQKRDTKVVLQGLNASVRRILNELGILQKLEPDSIVEDFDQALTVAIDHVAELYLMRGRSRTALGSEEAATAG